MTKDQIRAGKGPKMSEQELYYCVKFPKGVVDEVPANQQLLFILPHFLISNFKLRVKGSFLNISISSNQNHNTNSKS